LLLTREYLSLTHSFMNIKLKTIKFGLKKTIETSLYIIRYKMYKNTCITKGNKEYFFTLKYQIYGQLGVGQ